MFSSVLIMLSTLLWSASDGAASSGISAFRASPDQVLVLYNADYEKDADGSQPGQDSREVAEYYVKRHTDPESGKKPHLLGLSCRHGGKHLNHWFIEEKSQDNRNGLVFEGEGRDPGPDGWARDSRKVEIVVDPGKGQIDWDSVEVTCTSVRSGEEVRVTPLVSGVPEKGKGGWSYPEVEKGKGRCYRFNAHRYFQGTVTVRLRARDRAGKLVRNLQFEYHDRDDFAFSPTGADGVSDELHVQEDVIEPVKSYLEAPDNRLPDGTSLKEHILYIVVCHGLPFSCEGAFGIGHSPRAQLHSRGDLVSLEQKLQTIYYGWGDELTPPVTSVYLHGGHGSEEGVRNHRIVTTLRYSLIGPSFQPYVHPDTYAGLRGERERDFINIPPLVRQRKRMRDYVFAYGVSRLDGKGPEAVKRQIDYAVYGSRYLRPEMDKVVRERPDNKKYAGNLSGKLKEVEEKNLWGAAELQALGFRTPSGDALPFMARPSREVYEGTAYEVNDGNVGYYPGGMDFTVVSGNGWNKRHHGGIWDQVDRGVSISACGGPAYGGGPHITNATFFDPAILMRYLFRGRDLGECFLLSTVYVNWSTSLLGDPLFHPDLNHTVLDQSPPEMEKDQIRAEFFTAMGKYAGVITVPVLSTATNPEVAKLTVSYKKKEGGEGGRVSHQPMYSARPQVILRGLEPQTTYVYRPVLIDPYGNRTDLSDPSGPLTFTTENFPKKQVYKRPASKKKNEWTMNVLHRREFNDSGSITIHFTAGRNGMIPSIHSENLAFGVKRARGEELQAKMEAAGGGRAFRFQSPLEKGEDAVMLFRWRRRPLTREVLLVAKNGGEFPLAADVRTPWQDMVVRSPIRLRGNQGVEIHSAEIVSDAKPASDLACAVKVPDVDREAWRKANGKKAGSGNSQGVVDHVKRTSPGY